MAKDYKKIAEQQYAPQYNEKVGAVNNNLNSTVTGLEGSKSAINQNYDVQTQKQNLMNTLAKNNYNNQMLGRGIGKSSIATSGMAGMDNSNAKQVGYINMDRTNSLNGVDANIATARQNAANTISQLSADKLDYITKLAYELEDRDWDKDYKNQQMAWEKDSFGQTMAYNRANSAAEQAYRNQQLAMQQAEMDYAKSQTSDKNSASQDDYLSVQSIMQDKDMTLQQKRDYINAIQRSSKDSNFNSYSQEALDKIERQSTINNHIPNYQTNSTTQKKGVFDWWKNSIWNGNAFNIRNAFGK